MIADSPKTLLVLLAVLTFLGAVIGFCLAMIVAQRSARKVKATTPLELADRPLAAEPDLTVAGLSKYGLSEGTDRDVNDLGAQSLSSSDTLANRQAKRIQHLEAQLASLKDKQRRSRHEIASDKTTDMELELALGAVAQDSATARVPTLTDKVGDSFVYNRDKPSPSLTGDDAPHVSPDNSTGRRSTLVFPLTREIDIPTLAESELADSVDELDFDVSGTPDSGARGRG